MKIIQSLGGSILIVLSALSQSIAGTSITSRGSAGGVFTRLVTFLQETLNFMEGPLAVAVIVIGLVAALSLWSLAPDNRHLGRALKVVAAGVFIFSISTLLAQL